MCVVTGRTNKTRRADIRTGLVGTAQKMTHDSQTSPSTSDVQFFQPCHMRQKKRGKNFCRHGKRHRDTILSDPPLSLTTPTGGCQRQRRVASTVVQRPRCSATARQLSCILVGWSPPPSPPPPTPPPLLPPSQSPRQQRQPPLHHHHHHHHNQHQHQQNHNHQQIHHLISS